MLASIVLMLVVFCLDNSSPNALLEPVFFLPIIMQAIKLEKESTQLIINKTVIIKKLLKIYSIQI